MLPDCTHLERKEEGEPAEHIFRDLILSMWVDAKPDVAVQHGFEVACQSATECVSFVRETLHIVDLLENTCMRDVEGQLRGTRIVTVSERET